MTIGEKYIVAKLSPVKQLYKFYAIFLSQQIYPLGFVLDRCKSFISCHAPADVSTYMFHLHSSNDGELIQCGIEDGCVWELQSQGALGSKVF